MTNQLTAEQVAEHSAFLAKITAEHRRVLTELIAPLARIAAQGALDDYYRAAQDEVRFLHRAGRLDDDGDEITDA